MKKSERLKKIYPSILAVVLSFVSIVAVPLTYLRIRTDAANYEELCAEANNLFEKEIYTDAAVCFEELVKKTPEEKDFLYKYAVCCEKNEDESKLIAAVNELIKLDPYDERGYVLLCEWYYNHGKYALAYAVIENAEAAGKTETLAQYKSKMDALFVKRFFTADEVNEWHVTGGTSYAVFKYNGLCGILRGDGNISLSADYTSLGMYDADSGVMPVVDGNVACYIDTNGKRKLVSDTAYYCVGCFGSGLAPVCREGIYEYVDRRFVKKSREFDYAGAVCEGVCAVKLEGEWAVLNSSFESITSFDYDDINLNAYGHCSDYGLVGLKDEEGWHLMKTDGAFIQRTFENLALPASADGLIAYSENGKWGFCDREGKTVIDAQFDDAKSFSCGAAPVKSGDKWYYIGTDGKQINNEKYDYAGTFSDRGCAFVRSNGCSFLILMSKYN